MNRFIISLIVGAISLLANAIPSYYATISTEAYDGDTSPSTTSATKYTAYYCTSQKSAQLFNGANTIADLEAYFIDNFATGKSAIENNGEGMNATGYYADTQYTLDSLAYDEAVDIGNYIAVVFFENDAFRVFVNDIYNTENGHVVFDDAVFGTAGDWNTVPEPTSGVLILLGLAALGLRRKANQ